MALFLAHEETELSWNKSYLGYIERCVNVIVKLDYNIKVSALRLKELYRFSFEYSHFGLRYSHLAGLQSWINKDKDLGIREYRWYRISMIVQHPGVFLLTDGRLHSSNGRSKLRSWDESIQYAILSSKWILVSQKRLTVFFSFKLRLNESAFSFFIYFGLRTCSSSSIPMCESRR